MVSDINPNPAPKNHQVGLVDRIKWFHQESMGRFRIDSDSMTGSPKSRRVSERHSCFFKKQLQVESGSISIPWLNCIMFNWPSFQMLWSWQESKSIYTGTTKANVATLLSMSCDSSHWGCVLHGRVAERFLAWKMSAVPSWERSHIPSQPPHLSPWFSELPKVVYVCIC